MNDAAVLGVKPDNTVADAMMLKRRLRQSERRQKTINLLLIAPLFAFILITFLMPIGSMLFRSIDDPVVAANLPKTLAALENWQPPTAPDEAVYATLAAELVAARKARRIGKVGTRLNYEINGTRSLITRTAAVFAKKPGGPYKPRFLKMSKRWGQPKIWAALKRLNGTLTSSHYLAAVDATRNVDGDIVKKPEHSQIYVSLFFRTVWVGLAVTALCVLLAYPIAYQMATQPDRIANLLMIIVLLPFWTSLLVRTTTWIVLLQRQGVLNDLLVWLGILGDDGRIQMVYNLTGTLVAMTHILLPFMVLPLYSVMKNIPPSYMRAAQSLGAPRPLAFWRVYMPLTMPGVGAGTILVFISALGYYITPALVGGQSGQMISNLIAYHMTDSLNWGLAGALGGILLVAVLVLYWVYDRLVGIDNLKMG